MATTSHFLTMRIHSPSSSCSSLNMAIKFKTTLIRDFIFSHLCRFASAFTKAKSLVIELLLKEKHLKNNINFFQVSILKRKKNKNNDVFFGSFRLHYNWCSSSHVVPVTSQTMHYVDHAEIAQESSSQLSGYLQWLEDQKNKQLVISNNDESNEIDRLADKFIANCHQQFMLEKQESYRRFQEMMARSL
uniref:uncharacterized protein LOC122592012 n=1 Tax=Erigeron canadensis TaxID=72917 RepID=UPI001CB8A6AE|nr:uncharacterized protein LOC122592012 [Erigeron canadensis]